MDAIEITLDNITTKYGDLLDSIDFKKFRNMYNNNAVKSYKEHVKCKEGVRIKYFPYQNNGSLHIRFNIGKLLFGNNLVSIWSFNSSLVRNKLAVILSDIMDFSLTPPIRCFKVSNVELNLDIIRKRNEIDELYALIAKMPNTTFLKRFDKYTKDGSIYFCTGENPQECMRVKFYFKLRQLIKEGEPVYKYVADTDVINYVPGYDMLRLEVIIPRNWLLKLFRKDFLVYNSIDGYTEIQDYSGDIGDTGTLDDVMDILFQMRIIKHILGELHLDGISIANRVQAGTR